MMSFALSLLMMSDFWRGGKKMGRKKFHEILIAKNLEKTETATRLVLFHDGDEQYYAEPEDHHHQQLGKLISSVVLDGAVY